MYGNVCYWTPDYITFHVIKKTGIFCRTDWTDIITHFNVNVELKHSN